jgi:hypothetical protein
VDLVTLALTLVMAKLTPLVEVPLYSFRFFQVRLTRLLKSVIKKSN